jgi:hypothetical protein
LDKHCQPRCCCAVWHHAMKVTALLLSVVVLLLTACSSLDTYHVPSADLSRIHSYFVVHRLSDNHHMDDTIVEHLRSLGYEASAGPMTMMPQRTEAVVTYRDEWAWDFRTYLIQLEMEIRQAHTNRPIARGAYRQPTLITKSPSVVVERIFGRLFDQ